MNRKMKLLIIAILALIVFFLYKKYNLEKYISFESLKENRKFLLDFVSKNYILTSLTYILMYILSIAFLIPGATILTLAGGFMFGVLTASIYINIGATIGATIVFIMVRYFIGEKIQTKYEKQLEKFNKELDLNGSNYILMIRFIPVFPFFLINMLSGLTKIKLKTFIWTTSIGIFPGSLIYAYAGSNIKTIDKISDIASKEVLLAFLLLGILAGLPVFLKKLIKKGG